MSISLITGGPLKEVELLDHAILALEELELKHTNVGMECNQNALSLLVDQTVEQYGLENELGTIDSDCLGMEKLKETLKRFWLLLIEKIESAIDWVLGKVTLYGKSGNDLLEKLEELSETIADTDDVLRGESIMLTGTTAQRVSANGDYLDFSDFYDNVVGVINRLQEYLGRDINPALVDYIESVNIAHGLDPNKVTSGDLSKLETLIQAMVDGLLLDVSDGKAYKGKNVVEFKNAQYSYVEIFGENVLIGGNLKSLDLDDDVLKNAAIIVDDIKRLTRFKITSRKDPVDSVEVELVTSASDLLHRRNKLRDLIKDQLNVTIMGFAKASNAKGKEYKEMLKRLSKVNEKAYSPESMRIVRSTYQLLLANIAGPVPMTYREVHRSIVAYIDLLEKMVNQRKK